MAGGVRTIRTKFTGDTRDIEKASRRARGAVGGFAGKLGGVLKTAAKAGAVAVAGVAVAAAALGPKLIQQTGALELQAAKAKTVFEDQIGVVEKWARKNAAAMGLTSREAVNLAGGFADLLKPMGFSAKQAAGMATDVVGLSGALSEWSGGTVDAAGVADILSKAMLGEREGLKQLGISISEADVQARLAKKGQDGLTGAALAQAKATATQELIFEKSTDAQKAYAKGAGSLSRLIATGKAKLREFAQEMILKATPAIKTAAKWVKRELVPRLRDLATWAQEKLIPALKDMAAWFGEHIVPKLQAVARFIGDKVVPAIAGLVGWIEKNREIIPAVGIAIAALLVPAFIAWAISAGAAAIATIAAAAPIILIGLAVAALAFLIIKNWGTIKKVTLAVFRFVWRYLKGVWTGIVAAARFLWEAIRRYFGFWKAVLDKVIGWVVGVKDRAVAAFTRIVEFVKALPGRIRSAASGMWDGIKDAFRNALNWIIDKWNGLSFTLPSVTVFGKTIGGATISTPNLPRFHTGGVVPGPAGAEVPILARAGERILTREQDLTSGGGEFTGTLVLDSGQLLGLVRGEIQATNRGVIRRVLAGMGGAR